MKISLIQPSRNNLKYLKWSYDSIRKNQGEHEVEICVADDFSDDGTWEWCQKMIQKDPLFKALRNGGPGRLGCTILYDELINKLATNDICMIYHADMYLCPGALDAIEKHMYAMQDSTSRLDHEPIPKTIVSLTRIEPPLHPPGPEKILKDFGIEPEEFNEEGLLEVISSKGLYLKNLTNTTEGIFAPWAFWKKDFQEIGGHDPLYAPQSKEDSDIFNRFQLNGVKFVQTWEGFVYHMTCRGSRFNPHSGGAPGKDSEEWKETTSKNMKNFIRKWGHFVKHDQYLKPIIPPKYNIGIRVENCNPQLLSILEPWCDRVYADGKIDDYIIQEQPNTSFDLLKRVHSLTGEDKDDYDDIIVSIDGKGFKEEDFIYIQQLPEILQESTILEDDYGYEFGVGNLKVVINSMETYENNLIKV